MAVKLSTAAAAKAAKNLQYLTNEVSGYNQLPHSEQPSPFRFNRATFTKAERLCSKKLITKLFEEGSHFFEHPLKVIYLEAERISTYPVQILFSVPKKSFPKAHDRNRVKRLLREAYRRNKRILYEALDAQKRSLAVVIIYTSKTIVSFKEVEDKMKQVLHQLMERNL